MLGRPVGGVILVCERRARVLRLLVAVIRSPLWAAHARPIWPISFIPSINSWDINLIESNRKILLKIVMETTMDYYEGNTLEEQIVGLHRLVKLHYDLLNKLGF